MYEDEPQDRVHDVLAEAVFGEHPLGRRVLGEAEVIASIPVPDIEAYHQRPLHRRRTSSSAPPATSTTSAIVELAERLVAPAGRRRAAPTAAPTDDGARLRFYAEGDRAVPHLLRRARASPRRRAPLRARRARLDLRRLDLLAALPRGAREARPRLLGRLLQRAVHRPGLVATYVGTREDNVEEACAIIGAELARAARRAGLRRGADAGQGERQGPPRALLGVDRGADDADLARDPVRPADRQPRRDAGQGRRGRASTTLTELAAELYGAERLSAACVGARRGALPRGARRRSARRWLRGVIRGRRLRRRRAHGRRRSARRSRAPRTWSSPAGPTRRSASSSPRCSATPTSSSTSPRPTPRSPTSRACLEAGVHAVVGTTGFDLDELREAAERPAQRQLLRRPQLRDRRRAADGGRRRRSRRTCPSARSSSSTTTSKLDAPSGTAKRTAELIAKFGATKTFALPPASAAARSSSRSKPVVPTTAWTPASRQARTLSGAVSGGGEVDDDVGVVEDARRARRRAPGRPGR